MEALVPAFVAALLMQAGDRAALLTAILADRWQRPLRVALAAGLAHATGNAVAAIGGGAVAPMLNDRAQALMIGLALICGGAGGLWPFKMPDRLDSWRIGMFATSFLGIFALALGDRTQFLTFALAVRGQPGFAFAGAVAGCFATGFVAAVVGEAGWAKLPLRWLRIATGLLCLIAGAIISLGALELL